MNRPSLLSATAMVGALALASCVGDTTQPNPGATALGTPEAAVSSGTWTTLARMWPPRYLLAAGTVNKTIYVAGGQIWLPGSLDETARVDAYHVATNTWSQVKSLPSPVDGPYGVSAIDGRLYLAGGYTSGNPNKDLFQYTPATNSWVRKRSLPASVFAGPYCEGGAQGVIGAKLYIYVPCGPGYPGGRLLRYNPATNSYVWLPGPPVKHDAGGAGVINGKFYLASGASAGRQLHVYDPVTNVWTAKARLPAARYRVASAVLNGKLFLIGGQLTGVDHGDGTLTWYDPATNTWTEGPPMPTPRFAAAGASATGRVFVIGGADSVGVRGKVEAYTP
jgi:Kelch motif protein